LAEEDSGREAGAARESPGDVPLEALVERTSGPQPWRRIFHAFNGLLAAAVLSWTGISRGAALWILGVIVVVLLSLDAARLFHRGANVVFFRAFRHLASPREAKGLASSTLYASGLFLTVALFSHAAAVSGILLLALADPAASYVGRRWGRHRFLGGSVEGTGVFLVVSLALLLPRHPWPVALGAGVVTALAERLGWPLDDNVVVPLTGALAVTLLSGLA
jgi:dolichol kinase